LPLGFHGSQFHISLSHFSSLQEGLAAMRASPKKYRRLITREVKQGGSCCDESAEDRSIYCFRRGRHSTRSIYRRTIKFAMSNLNAIYTHRIYHFYSYFCIYPLFLELAATKSGVGWILRSCGNLIRGEFTSTILVGCPVEVASQ
jgi:hypothetical protein